MSIHRIAVFALLFATFPALARAADDEVKLDPAAIQRWGGAQYVVIGKLEAVKAGPVGQSFPPMYTHRLTLIVEESLRGPAKKGDRLELSHVARQPAPPTFPQGKTCLVAASAVQGGITVKAIEEANEKNSAAAKQVCALPAGWTVKDGKLVSPWATLGKDAWSIPGGAPGDVKALRCIATGRPVLLAGANVALTVTPVPPKQAIQWTNPDGDGEYTITVTNKSDQPVEIPALLTDGKDILWNESLVIECQNKSYVVPGSKGVSNSVKPTTLKPGESVSTVINALKLQGPEWPRGGYRIQFQFCLGEHTVVHSFYYMSKHHDPIRAKLGEGQPKK